MLSSHKLRSALLLGSITSSCARALPEVREANAEPVHRAQVAEVVEPEGAEALEQEFEEERAWPVERTFKPFSLEQEQPAPEQIVLSGSRRVRVTALGLRNPPSIGFFTHNGQSIGSLQPVHALNGMLYEGYLPRTKVHIFVQGQAEDAALRGERVFDLADENLDAEDLSVEVKRQPNHVRRLKLVDAGGRALPRVSGEVVLDGSHDSARNAVLNYQRLVSDDAGRIELLLSQARKQRVAFELPFSEHPILVEIGATQNQVKLPVHVVHCAFRCENGRIAGYAGFVAVLKLKDGTEQRVERPYSDALRGNDALFVWPKGAREISVHSTGFHSATLGSPKQKCLLRPLGQRVTCESN